MRLWTHKLKRRDRRGEGFSVMTGLRRGLAQHHRVEQYSTTDGMRLYFSPHNIIITCVFNAYLIMHTHIVLCSRPYCFDATQNRILCF